MPASPQNGKVGHKSTLGEPPGHKHQNGNGSSLTLQQRTPPPDNWRHIQPCSHLTKVLATSAHDTVMATYKQAVGILVAVNPLLKERLVFRKKDGLAVPQNTFNDLKHKVLRCSDCNLANFHQVFFCLQCPHVGCYQEHARAHAAKQNHMFAIDAQNGLLFCFSCKDYINHSALNDIRLAVASMDDIQPSSDKQAALSEYYDKPAAVAIHGLKGIVNLGATCFMSCVLQTLLHNPLVRNHFFNNDLHFFNCPLAQQYLDEGNIDSSTACITCLVDAVFKQVYCASSNEGFGITTLLQTAWYKNQLLAGFSEQDAHEFWQFLLNEFHADHEKVLQEAHLDIPSPERCLCITHSVFLGELESLVECSSCGFVRSTVDPLVDLSLEVNDLNHKTNTLYECLDQFTHTEALDAKSSCQSCGTESKPFRSLRIRKLPPVLSIQLKRFKHNHANDTASKIETKVDTPLYLNLTKYVSDYNNEGNDDVDSGKVYELFGVITHIGSVNTGHYVAFIKNSIGQWFKFDDSVVSHASHHDVQNTNAYLLFYIAHFS
ncbi:hypothetical protein C7M61_003645 [Candidozyma pseudohaemuli]|uniref:Ubiquitin carboxyl-terminal hydrolase n=1 Tax=Candidozyma pseudohaemuli TaxID=418784 RepID=A0A2P7YLD2_9ASCO|nr:hypothetical protein C7M61_003645 [[Candida] pseudohaemulonii]PSK36783.1 hypothetical protein C7M61_003645 [[Candida] pseudohaemulonii]